MVRHLSGFTLAYLSSFALAYLTNQNFKDTNSNLGRLVEFLSSITIVFTVSVITISFLSYRKVCTGFSFIEWYQLKLINMRAKLANLNDCAVPFLSRAAANLCWYYYTCITVLVSQTSVLAACLSALLAELFCVSTTA